MIASGLCSYRSLFVRVTCWPYMADQPPSVTTELTLLSRVAYRDREINGPRLRGLLALLAGDLRTGCSAARLMEGLWPDEQPENPAKALQILVSRARAQLGSDVIASTPTGYRLSLREDQVDTSAVLLSASASVRCSRAGDHAAALAHAEEGLALWEGDAGGDAAFDDPVSALREERVSTYRSLVPARWRCRGWAAMPRRPRRLPIWSVSARGTRSSCWSCCAARRRRWDRRRRWPGTSRTAARCATSSAPTPAPHSRPCTNSCCRGPRRWSGTVCRTSPTRCSAATMTSPRWRTCCAPPA